MKRLIAILLVSCLVFLPNIIAFSIGDGNIDGGGGNIGDGGTGESNWSPGDDGVRVSIIQDGVNTTVRGPIDFSNRVHAEVERHFGSKNKLMYKSSSVLAPTSSIYHNYIFSISMPRIINTSGGSNIEALKRYFSSENVLKEIANMTGLPFETLIDGNHIILLEPISYFKFKGITYAMTATEAALLNLQTGNQLRMEMGDLTHKNLPLSMFLETSDIGFSAWGGQTSSYVSDQDIISELGLGIVYFKEPPPPDDSVVQGTLVYDYRTETDVITAVTIRANGNITPLDNARVTFNINGTNHTMGFVCPQGGEQIVYARWRTPSTPITINISVSTTAGTLEHTSITANVKKLEENTPPDPTGRDRNDNFKFKEPSKENNKKAEWGVWNAYWKPNRSCNRNCPDGIPGCNKKHGPSTGNGRWIYTYDEYSATLKAISTIISDKTNPTATKKGDKWTIKSGYGINVEQEVSVSIGSGTPLIGVTDIQNSIATFSEFGYEVYNRLLVPEDGVVDKNITYIFKDNEFSQWDSSIHFTPIWYPDEIDYVVKAVVFDCWTPGGQLYATSTDEVNIYGNVYDDWAIRPVI